MSANTNKKLVAIVTGASSGMGLGITRALISFTESLARELARKALRRDG